MNGLPKATDQECMSSGYPDPNGAVVAAIDGCGNRAASGDMVVDLA